MNVNAPTATRDNPILMKHPLTSKERRGLLAVAAAALLCISSAFIFRNCSSLSHQSLWQGAQQPDSAVNVSDTVSGIETLPMSKSNGEIQAVAKPTNAESAKRNKKIKKNKASKNNTNKKKAPKVYPIRDPLSEPCD